MKKIIWTDRVVNDDVILRVLHTIKTGRLTRLVTSCVGTAF